MSEETEKLTLDSRVPKSKALAGWLGIFLLSLIFAYFFIGSAMIGSKISDLSSGGIFGFAIVTILLLAVGNRFGKQFSREVLTLEGGILTYQEYYFWLPRRISFVRDEVNRFEIQNSPFSFSVTVVAVNGRRTISRDIARGRKEDYISALTKFAPVTPDNEAEQAEDAKHDNASR